MIPVLASNLFFYQIIHLILSILFNQRLFLIIYKLAISVKYTESGIFRSYGHRSIMDTHYIIQNKCENTGWYTYCVLVGAYQFQAKNCLIHFYKRFQIKSGSTRSLCGPNYVLDRQLPIFLDTSALQRIMDIGEQALSWLDSWSWLCQGQGFDRPFCDRRS